MFLIENCKHTESIVGEKNNPITPQLRDSHCVHFGLYSVAVFCSLYT